MNRDDLRAYKEKARRQRDNWKRKAVTYEQAIRETLEDNRHLADGENCTLIKLKRVLSANDQAQRPPRKRARSGKETMENPETLSAERGGGSLQRMVRPSRQSIVAFTATGPTVRIGGCLLRQLSDNSIWLENEIGEGMQVNPKLLESCLTKFMAKHF